MYKVFLVEDEIVVREGLKKIVPWQQHGFTIVGDASDGETALPGIRQTRPDVLITDIKMPFMDGLALAKIVQAELPNIHIIVLSGYDDFEYAQKAIALGVSQYLLKPITRAELVEVLQGVKQKLDAERERAGYMEKFRQEVQANEQYSRRRFFEELVGGRLTVPEIYQQAEQHGIDIAAQQYNIVQFVIQQREGDEYSEPLSKLVDDLILALECSANYLLFQWNLFTWAVLVKGRPDTIAANTDACIETVTRWCTRAGDPVQWYVACGEPVGRLHQLSGCFAAVSRRLSYRFLYPEKHILDNAAVPAMDTGSEEEHLNTLKVSTIDASHILNFVKSALPYEVEDFTEQYLDSIGDGALQSLLFTQYLLLNTRFTVTAYIESIGLDRAALNEELEAYPIAQIRTREQIAQYIAAILRKAVTLREQASANRYHGMIEQALHYVDDHYTAENLSMNQVAKEVNLSPSYFSALFSQEVGQTFTEYITAKRMDRACELLRTTDLRSGEVAFAVGYQDPHYFSFLFKKNLGMTPREYRAGALAGTPEETK